MPAPNPQEPQGLIEYLVHGTKQSDHRATQIENDNHYGPWIDPELLNGYLAVDAPKRTVQYRWNYKAGKPDFRGHVDGRGTISGDVIFYLDASIVLDHDITFITEISISDANFSWFKILVSSSDNSVVGYF